MIRRFNYTGRRKLTRDLIPIRLVKESSSGAQYFSADFSGLATLGLPSNARVFVDSHVRQSSMRFDFGTIGRIAPPVDTALTEIDSGEVPQFRVMVVDADSRPGRLLAVAEQIRPMEEETEDSRKPILPLYVTDLGEQIWQLDAGRDTSPILKINSRIPQLRERLDGDPVLRGAIFPIAVRGVLQVILRDQPDPTLDWVKDWRMFAESLIGQGLPGDDAEPDDFDICIDRVVEVFCEQHHWAASAQPNTLRDESDYD